METEALKLTGRNRQFGDRGGGTYDTSNNKPLLPWRKYDKYCFSKGINLHCDGSNCRRLCNKTSKHDHTATYHNKKGGSVHLENRWEKWCGPDNNIYEKKTDYTGPTKYGDK